MPIQEDVSPRRWQHPCDQGQRRHIAARLVFGEQLRQNRGIVVDDGVRDQSRALIADLDFNVGSTGQLFLSADPADG